MWMLPLLALSVLLSWRWLVLSRHSIKERLRNVTRKAQAIVSLAYVVPFLLLVQIVLVPSDRRKAQIILRHRLSLQGVITSENDESTNSGIEPPPAKREGTGGTKRRDSGSGIRNSNRIAIESRTSGSNTQRHPPTLAPRNSGVSTCHIYYCAECSGWHLSPRPRTLPEHTIVDENGQVPACTKCLSLNCMTHYPGCENGSD